MALQMPLRTPGAAAWLLTAWMFALPIQYAGAQTDTLAYHRDTVLLKEVYAWQAPVLTIPLQVANRTSYPMFALVPLAAYAAGDGWQPAARVVASELAAGVLAFAVKQTVGRPRPYTAHPDVVLRSDRTDRAVLARDSFGFPSGHAAFAFAAATSLSLSYPEWYVIVPAQAWATTVALSRVWHGAHYPSDVLAGAALGFVVAGAVHVLWPGGRDEQEVMLMPVLLRVRL